MYSKLIVIQLLVFIAVIWLAAFCSNTSFPAPMREETAVIRNFPYTNILRLEGGKEVRLAGILAPEQVLPEGKMMPEISGFIGKTVVIEEIPGMKDRNRRPLVAAKIAGSHTTLQEHLLQNGWAILYPDGTESSEAWKEAERQAREGKKGIWASSLVVKAEDAERHPETYADSFRLVEGRAVSVTKKKQYIYVNFNRDWRTDFTLRLEAANMPLETVAVWQGKHIRARGWLESFHGPMMEVTDRGQVEVD